MAHSAAYVYVDEDSINHSLKCSICNEPFVRPVSTNCRKKHTFCRRCIEQWLTRHSSCPTCRQVLRPEDLASITEDIIKDVLNELHVKCTSCGQDDLERGDFDSHLKHSCPMTIVTCPAQDIHCPWDGYRKQLAHHLKKCPFQALRPILVPLIDDNQKLRKQLLTLTNQMKDYQSELQRLNNRLSEQTIKIDAQHTELIRLWRRSVFSTGQRSAVTSAYSNDIRSSSPACWNEGLKQRHSFRNHQFSKLLASSATRSEHNELLLF